MLNQNNSTSVTDDDIKKAKEYTDAMDKLKNAISSVNSKLPEFSNGLQAGLKALGEKLPDVVEAMTKLNAQNKELAASGQKPVSIFTFWSVFSPHQFRFIFISIRKQLCQMKFKTYFSRLNIFYYIIPQ